METVAEGDTVVILESMKMEMPVEAEDDGTVAEICVAGGPGRHEGDTLVVGTLAGSLAVDTPAEGVARVTIDNAAKRNALDRPILEGLAATLPELDARCIVVTGRRDVFSAGYDIGDLSAVSAWPRRRRSCSRTRSRRRWRRWTRSRCRSWPRWAGTRSAAGWSSRWPATCASARRARSSACRRRGSASSTRTPGLRRFVDAIGAARTRELFLTARPITADTALAWGLVNEVVEDVADHAVALAAEIASLSPAVAARQQARAARARPAARPALVAELHALRDAAFRSEDFAEGVRAFTEKRASPRWRGAC